MSKAPDGFVEFLREIAPGRKTVQIQDEIRKQYGIEMPIRTIEGYKTANNIRSFEYSGGHKVKEYPPEIRTFIIDNCHHVSHEHMATIVNERFKTNYSGCMMYRFYKRNNLNSMLGGKHSDGLVNPLKGRRFKRKVNKGFQNGRVPKNKCPVGTVKKRKQGYYIKTAEPNKWQPFDRVLWEEANGKIPDGYVIVYLDGNKYNVELSNMVLIERRLALYHSANGIRTQSAGMEKTSIQLSRLKLAISDKVKSMNSAKENDHECTVHELPEQD